MIGKTISHFKILEKIGRGGMGVVYKAMDLNLDRTVALKFLPPEVTPDRKARERFAHEAKVVSALQHQNVCTIHEIGESEDGQMFICMDFYEGETLKDRMESAGAKGRSPLQIDEYMDIAMQTAQGLAKAQGKGIIHRDLKPANIFITNDGVVKILDFGLVKLAGQTKLTKTGSTMGTVAYMSPEQARGEDVDQRTDIWSLGVVMYEMITGRLPFEGEYEQTVIYGILNQDPKPVSELCAGVPDPLEKTIHRALSKDPKDRHACVEDLVSELMDMQGHRGGKPDIRKIIRRIGRIRKKRFFYAGVILLPIFISGLIFFGIKGFRKPLPPWLQPDAVPERLTTMPGDESGRISPDGNYVLVSGEMNYLGIMDTKTKVVDPVGSGSGLYPTWSPDGSRFVYAQPNVGESESELFICNFLRQVTFRLKEKTLIWDLTWSPDGSKLAYCCYLPYNQRITIFKIIGVDGKKIKEFSLQGIFYNSTWSSDSRKIVLIERLKSDVYPIRIMDAETGSLSEPLKDVRVPKMLWWYRGMAWSPDGRFLVFPGYYGKDIELFALPMNAKNYSPAGRPIRITKMGGMGTPYWPTFTRGGKRMSYSVSETNRDIHIFKLDVNNAKITGEAIPVATNRMWDEQPSWSPDEKKIVYRSMQNLKWDLYVLNLETKELLLLTNTVREEKYPQFSPDGQSIGFWADSALWTMPSGGGSDSRLTPDTLEVSDRNAWLWSKDNGSVFFIVVGDSMLGSCTLMKMDLRSKAIEILIDRFNGGEMVLSPDGMRLAIDESVVTIPEPGKQINKEKLQIRNIKTLESHILLERMNHIPAGQIFWTPDGRYLIQAYLTPDLKKLFLELIPLKEGLPQKIKIDSGDLKEQFIFGPVSPSGNRALITNQTQEGDVWILGKESDSQ